MSSNTKLVVGLSVGICTGAAAALLVAPKSGKDTRQTIKSRSGALKRRAGELITRRRAA
jgi:gas vesicle protein